MKRTKGGIYSAEKSDKCDGFLVDGVWVQRV